LKISQNILPEIRYKSQPEIMLFLEKNNFNFSAPEQNTILLQLIFIELESRRGNGEKFENQLQNIENQLEKKDFLYIYCLHVSAITYKNIGKFKQAYTYYHRALSDSNTIAYYLLLPDIYYGMGLVNKRLYNPNEALETFELAIQKADEFQNHFIKGAVLNEMGNLLLDQGAFEKATLLFASAEKIREKINDYWGLAAVLHNQGMLKLKQNLPHEALDFFNKSLEIKILHGDQRGIAPAYYALALAFSMQKNIEKTLQFYELAMNKCTQYNDHYGKAKLYEIYPNIYADNPQKLIFHLEDGLSYCLQINANEVAIHLLPHLINAYKSADDFRKALLHTETYLELKINNVNQHALNAQKSTETRLELLKSVQQNELLVLQNEQLTVLNDQLNSTQTKLANTLATLHTKNQYLIETLQRFEKISHKTLEGLQYARRIQQAIMPPLGTIKKLFKGFDVFFQPKNVVSGDFYWFGKVDQLAVLVVGDCTGHGVSGAFMTLLTNTLLNELVKGHKITDPSNLLFFLDKKLNLTLNIEANQLQDGLDISVVVYHESSKKIVFSGAKQHLTVFRNGQLHQIKGNRNPIGGTHFQKKEFTNHYWYLAPDDVCYLFSDGIVDQFGGVEDKKFGRKRLNELLCEVGQMPVSEQVEKISKAIKSWRGYANQTDDMVLTAICYF